MNNIIEFHNKFKQRSKEGKDKKEILMKNTCTLYERRELTINAFKSRIFTLKSTQGKGLKILSLKQMFPWLPIVFSQINQVKWNSSYNIFFGLIKTNY